MAMRSDPGIVKWLGRSAIFCSATAVGFGMLALSGWAFHIRSITTILPGQVAVKVNTAVCFILMGLALWLSRTATQSRSWSRRGAAQSLALLAAVVGLLSFLEFWYDWNLGIDQLLFTAGPEDIPGSVRSGLMSPITAVAFTLLGPAVALLGRRDRRAQWLVQGLASVVAVITTFGILDFVLEPNATHTHISPITALVLFLFSFGVMFSRTECGLSILLASPGSGGQVARRLLPAAIAVPIVIAWLHWKGQIAGFYSEWTGVTLTTVGVIVLLASFALWTAVAIERSDEKRQRAEVAARRLASIVTGSSDAIIGKRLDGIIENWNAGAEAIYGYSAAEMVGRHISVLIPPDHADEFNQIMEKIQRGEPVRYYETARLHKDGTTIQVSVSVSPVKDDTGRVVGASTIARDISERRRAERKLREAWLYTRSLIEASLDPLVTISREGKITDVNEATEKITGVGRDRLIGSDFSDYFTEPEKARAGYEEVFAKGTVHDYPLAIRHTSGRVTEVLYNACIFKNERGEVGGVFAAARDITARKRVQDELRLSLERLALAQKAGHSGTFDWDIPNNVNRWSPEAEEVYGLEPGTFGGRFEDWERMVLPEDLPTAQAAIQESLRTGEFISEWRIQRHSDGQIRWITAGAKVIFDEAGKPARMLGLNMDVTERKQAEEEVRRLNAELEQRVIQRTAALEASNKELEAFTYSVSHDLRAPLRHISGFSKILSEEFGSNLPEEAQHHLQRIEEGTRRMGLLVDDLLNLARIGRRDLILQVTGLTSVVDEVIAELKPEFEGREMTWKIASMPVVECDPGLMKQVFQNLLSNAVKFTRPRPQAVIEINQTERDGVPALYVRDNGVGFSMKYADKLFGVFQRLHRAEDFEGTGVGLATVQRIIQKHGGRIWAEAELDKGATFYFTLGSSAKTDLRAKAAVVGEQA